MKVGDRVRSTKYKGLFKIIEYKVETTLGIDDKPVVRLTYLAMDETSFKTLKFFGYDIGKTVFKTKDYEQLKLF